MAAVFPSINAKISLCSFPTSKRCHRDNWIGTTFWINHRYLHTTSRLAWYHLPNNSLQGLKSQTSWPLTTMFPPINRIHLLPVSSNTSFWSLTSSILKVHISTDSLLKAIWALSCSIFFQPPLTAWFQSHCHTVGTCYSSSPLPSPKSVVVFSHAITNYHVISGLRQHLLLSHSPVGYESRYGLTGSSAKGPTGPKSQYQPGLKSHLRLEFLSQTHWLTKFSSF